MLNLDTHIILHALAGSLRPEERRLLENTEWSISAIVYWEIAKLKALGRIDVDLRDAEVSRALSRPHVWPITLEIARVSQQLDVDVDPADELIGATSIVHNVPLLTRDRALRRSRMIPHA